MKVLKFGGTSVGNAGNLKTVKNIICDCSENVIVVVSAFGGMTDKLITAAKMASSHDTTYKDVYKYIKTVHEATIDDIFDNPGITESTKTAISPLLKQLNDLLNGLYLIGDLSDKTLDTIVSYGERMSSLIISRYIDEARWVDSRLFIKTEKKHSQHLVDNTTTYHLIREILCNLSKVTIVPGFISSDVKTGDTTNLGRGGSDYTASLIAAALDAEILEIWTDVDGFMTADPKVISSAYTIPHLSYIEAMEITSKAVDNGRLIKGISSIADTALITVSGLGMVGVIGVNYRIFRALAQASISVFLVAQASSENSTSIGVKSVDAEPACQALNEEFEREIKAGLINLVKAEYGLSTVAVVGENMKHTPGIAGKLFGTLGRNGINAKTFAQGASERNISFVIDRSELRKALNVIHDSFFLSEYKVLNIFICGIGTVGHSLIEQINDQRMTLMKKNGLKLNIIGIANSKHLFIDKDGVNLNDYRSLLDKQGIPSCPQLLEEKIIELNLFNSVFVDCTASEDIAGIYQSLLSHNVSIVTANKIAASGPYDNYNHLKSTAVHRGVKFLFETNVGAGLPIINTINDLINSGDKILKIEAVLSGTLNYVFNTLSPSVPFSQTVNRAVEEGYAEPDPRIDLSGKDVARKLVILAREAGYRIEQDDIAKNNFIPTEMMNASLEDFKKQLPSLDAQFEEERQRLETAHKRLRFIARLDEGKGEIGLEEVPAGSPFYNLEGSNNIVLITTERYREYPMCIQGYGAGASVTAAGVFADIIRIANI